MEKFQAKWFGAILPANLVIQCEQEFGEDQCELLGIFEFIDESDKTPPVAADGTAGVNLGRKYKRMVSAAVFQKSDGSYICLV